MINNWKIAAALVCSLLVAGSLGASQHKAGSSGSRSATSSSGTTHAASKSTARPKVTTTHPPSSATRLTSHRQVSHVATRPTSHRQVSHVSARSSVATRDAAGRIKRSQAARSQFMRRTGFPKGRPGYAIDHVVPLACGGLDAPSNMQWQTVAAARAKDKYERRGCGR